jgi:epoxyqueuosine reductase QueG
VIDDMAERCGAIAIYPFVGPPWLPFQAWARRAGGGFVSPLGLLIHPDFGLWQSYRGALAFREQLDVPVADAREHPCESCADRPCLSRCPVTAFTPAGYDVDACAAHIATPAGAPCMKAGCQARRACPVGAEHRYGAEQTTFYMRAFLAGRERESGR